MSALARDTTLTPAGGGRWRAQITPAWHGGAGPHGGFLAALFVRALTEVVADPERAPRSLTIHFLRPPAAGPVELAATVERAGRSLSTLSARMEQDGRVVALALAAFSTAWDGPELDETQMPEAPPPEELHRTSFVDRMPPFFRQLDMRPAVGTTRIFEKRESAYTGGWMGLREPAPVDAPTAAFLLDAFWPTVYTRLDRPYGAPTIDYTIHFRRRLPYDDEPLVLGVFRSRLAHDGFFEEDGELWSRDGALLAHSRQLALLIPLEHDPRRRAQGSDPSAADDGPAS